MSYAWAWMPNMTGTPEFFYQDDVSGQQIPHLEKDRFLAVDRNGLFCKELKDEVSDDAYRQTAEEWKELLDSVYEKENRDYTCVAARYPVIADDRDRALNLLSYLFVDSLDNLSLILNQSTLNCVSSSDVKWPEHLAGIRFMKDKIDIDATYFKRFMSYYGHEIGATSSELTETVDCMIQEASIVYDSKMFSVKTEYEHSTMRTNRRSLVTAEVAMSITAVTSVVNLVLRLLSL
ncbi:MAG: hypothetical protein Q4Q58_07000 [Thermoplasmata archaeon]|nr:hypothetical protein [Thermoplasmata archaeon]